MCFLQEVSENEEWLVDFWNKLNIKPIKFKNKVFFKTTEFKIDQEDKYKAVELINNIIQNTKKKFFCKIE